MKAKEKNKVSRAEAFDSFYREIWGGRWDGLKEALLSERTPAMFTDGLAKPYALDKASVLVSSLMPLSGGLDVLDMCAAPGGKSLCLLSRMDGGSFVANDRSRERKIRLGQVLSDHLPEDKRSLVRTTCSDASKIGLREKEAYDRILLDAPCSSERHVLSSEKHMAMWSINRPKRLAIEQYSLLSSAAMALRKGGYILYSTCSVNPAEDELVIEKLFKRHGEEFLEVEISLPCAEKRQHGILILPDTADNMGPLYACLLRKRDE